MQGFQCQQVTVPGGTIALWHHPDSKGKPKVLMGHGNGLNALCQIELMAALGDQFDVYGMDFRGHGSTKLPLPDTPENPWGWYAADLEDLIDRHFGGSVSYVGHSMAAVTAFRLARRRPHLFKKLIALDPAILASRKARLYPLLRGLGFTKHLNGLYAGTLKRRNTWPDRAVAVAYFTGRKAFATWPDAAVGAYIEGGLRDDGQGGLTLACPRGWEARTFKYVPTEIEWILKQIESPCLLIRAERGSIEPKTLKVHANTKVKTSPGTHFAHLEQPEAIAALIKNFI